MSGTFDADLILLRVMVEKLAPHALEDPAIDPVRIVESARTKAPRRADKMLAMGLRDVMSMAQNLSPAERAEIDQRSVERGGVTMGAVLARDGKLLARIIARGAIHNEDEFYLVGTIADITDDGEQRVRLWDLLGEYELRDAAP